jgi:hypothetical protein
MSAIVQKLWNYCNVLRDDLSAPDCELRSGRCEHPPAPWQAGAQADGMSYLLARTCLRVHAGKHADRALSS